MLTVYLRQGGFDKECNSGMKNSMGVELDQPFDLRLLAGT